MTMSTISSDPKDLHFMQMRGSTTVLKVMQQIGLQYMDEYPNIHLPLLGGGSALGYKSVLDGTCSIGMASGQIPSNIQLWAHKHKLILEEFPIASDGLVAIVNPANPISDLTFDQLHGIFTGSITNWNMVGKFSGPINVVSHDPQLGTYEPWKRQVAGKEYITLKAKVINNLKDLTTSITSDPHAIGYVGTTFLNADKVKPLAINGITPTYSNIKKRLYPIRNNLLLLTKGSPNKEIKHLIAYCLDPTKGQVIIKKMGLVPVEGD